MTVASLLFSSLCTSFHSLHNQCDLKCQIYTQHSHCVVDWWSTSSRSFIILTCCWPLVAFCPYDQMRHWSFPWFSHSGGFFSCLSGPAEAKIIMQSCIWVFKALHRGFFTYQLSLQSEHTNEARIFHIHLKTSSTEDSDQCQQGMLLCLATAKRDCCCQHQALHSELMMAKHFIKHSLL